MAIATVGQLIDSLSKLPRDMHVWVGMPTECGLNQRTTIEGISTDPDGGPNDNCGIILRNQMKVYGSGI